MIGPSQTRAAESKLCPENVVAKRICEVIGQGRPLVYVFSARPASKPVIGFCKAETQFGRKFGVLWQHAAAVDGEDRVPGVHFTVSQDRRHNTYRLSGLISFEDLGSDTERASFIEFMGNRMLDAMADKGNVVKT